MEVVHGMAQIFPGIPHSQCLTFFHRLCWNKNAVSPHIISITKCNRYMYNKQLSASCEQGFNYSLHFFNCFVLFVFSYYQLCVICLLAIQFNYPNRVWKGIFGIWDLAKIHCGKFLDRIWELIKKICQQVHSNKPMSGARSPSYRPGSVQLNLQKRMTWQSDPYCKAMKK